MKSIRNVLFGLAIMAAGLAQQACVTDVARAKMDAVGGVAQQDTGIGPSSIEGAMRALNVQIEVSASGKESDEVGAEVKKIVESELAGKHFILSPTDPEMTVSLTPHASLFDKSGSYYRYNGRVDVRIVRNHDRRLMGEKTFTVPGERKLDQEEALLAVSQKLGPQAAEWVTGVCTPLQVELLANDITVHRFLPAKPSSDSRYATLFVEKVGALAGVKSCRLIRHDYESRTLVFRVVYSRDLIPQGLLDRVATIPDLNIRAQ